MWARISRPFLGLLVQLALTVVVAARIFAARQLGPVLLSVGRIAEGPRRGAKGSVATMEPAQPKASLRASVDPSLSAYPEVLRPAPSPPLPRQPGSLAPALGRAAKRLRARLAAHRLDLAIVGSLLLAVGIIHGLNMDASPAFFDDEGTYVSQSWAITHLGELAPYTYWYDHPPLGWLLMAGWSLLAQPFSSGGWSIAGFRALMLILVLVDTLLLYAIARRLPISRAFATLAVLLFALSPLAVHYQRMVLLDNLAVTWTLAAFFLVLSPRRKLAEYALAGVCFAAAALSKETFLLVFPALAFLAWQRVAKGPTRSFSITMFLAGFVLVAVFYPLYATLQGEFIPGAGHTSLVNGVSFQLTRAGGGGLANPHSGTRQLIDSWLADDSLLLPAALVLTPLALASTRLRAMAVAFALPVLIAARPSAYVPAMFVIGLLPFAALIVAGVADRAWRWARRAERSGRLGGLRALAAAPALLAVIGGVLVWTAPDWARADLHRMSHDDQSAGRQAVNWLDRNVDHRSTLLVDDTVWVDLVQRGFAPQRTIWFYKLDLDPGVTVPWQRFDYVLRSNMMEGNSGDLPRTRVVLDHSRPLATFTDGPERMEVRRVIHPAPPVSTRPNQRPKPK